MLNLDAAREIFKNAHQLGDLDVRKRRPDGSVIDRLHFHEIIGDPWGNPDPWKSIFETGQIDAPRRSRRGALRRRRAQPLERCRIVVTRDSLKEFMQTMPPATTGDQARAIEHLGNLLKDNPDMKRGDAYKACKQFKIGPGVFRTSVWPKARKEAGLPIAAKHGRKPKR